MKLSTIFAGVMLAVSANAAAAPQTVTEHVKFTVTEVQTVTKFPKPVTTTVIQTVTKARTVKTTVFATVTGYRTKTKKFCPPSASPTMSIYGRDVTNLKPRVVAEQPLYVKEFA